MGLKFKEKDGQLESIKVPKGLLPSGKCISSIKVRKGNVLNTPTITLWQDEDFIILHVDLLNDFITALKEIKERGV
jgi:hypothetical protein